jgi:hypothetical protein
MSTNNNDKYGDLIDEPANVDIRQQDVHPVNRGTVFPVDSKWWETMLYNTRDYWVFGLCLPPPHLRTETDPLFETLCSLMFFRIPDDGQSPKTKEGKVIIFRIACFFFF